MMQEFIAGLEQLGFSRNEAKVYLNLAKHGSSKAGQIAKRALTDRSSVYNALNSLLNKGLVSYAIIGKVKWFQCSNPKNILNYFNHKVEIARSFIPELEKLRKESLIKENVRLFKGHKGVKTVFEDILRTAKENLIFGSEGQFSEKMPNFAKKFVSRLENKGIKVRSIVRSVREIEHKQNIRRIPSKVESPVVTNIWNKKIAMIIWGDVPEAILIENENAAKAWREYFEFMWKHAEK